MIAIPMIPGLQANVKEKSNPGRFLPHAARPRLPLHHDRHFFRLVQASVWNSRPQPQVRISTASLGRGFLRRFLRSFRGVVQGAVLWDASSAPCAF